MNNSRSIRTVKYKELHRILNGISDLLFPPRCPICDDIVFDGNQFKTVRNVTPGNNASGNSSSQVISKKYNTLICPACRTKVVRIKEPFCARCGKALASEAEYCKDCMNRKHYFIQGMSVFDYGSVSDSLFRFKNKGRREYAKFYAYEILKARGMWLKSINPDALIPVPIHQSKLLSRGYNQAELISKEISKITKIPTLTDIVIRCKKTNPLKSLSLTERQNNIKNAFKVSENAVKLKTIVIIDDIYTTGTTIDEISRVIKARYDCKIYFLTLAIGRG